MVIRDVPKPAGSINQRHAQLSAAVFIIEQLRAV